MLPGAHRLRRNADFKVVFAKGKVVETQFIKVKFCKNSVNLTRFGFIVGLKFSKKSTLRNLIKRRLRAAIQSLLKNTKPGYDVVIWPKNKIINANHQELINDLQRLFEKNDILLI